MHVANGEGVVLVLPGVQANPAREPSVIYHPLLQINSLTCGQVAHCQRGECSCGNIIGSELHHSPARVVQQPERMVAQGGAPEVVPLVQTRFDIEIMWSELYVLGIRQRNPYDFAMGTFPSVANNCGSELQRSDSLPGTGDNSRKIEVLPRARDVSGVVGHPVNRKVYFTEGEVVPLVLVPGEGGQKPRIVGRPRICPAGNPEHRCAVRRQIDVPIYYSKRSAWAASALIGALDDGVISIKRNDRICLALNLNVLVDHPVFPEADGRAHHVTSKRYR